MTISIVCMCVRFHQLFLFVVHCNASEHFFCVSKSIRNTHKLYSFSSKLQIILLFDLFFLMKNTILCINFITYYSIFFHTLYSQAFDPLTHFVREKKTSKTNETWQRKLDIIIRHSLVSFLSSIENDSAFDLICLLKPANQTNMHKCI